MTDPQDGKGPIKIWWEDMRPDEIRKLVKEVFERGRGWRMDGHEAVKWIRRIAREEALGQAKADRLYRDPKCETYFNGDEDDR